MSVIKLERTVDVFVLEHGDLLAMEMSTYGLNKPNETYGQYCERMDYHEAKIEPRCTLPAIPLRVVWPFDGYVDVIYIDRLNNGEDDPVMVCCWDFYGLPGDRLYGEHQHCYIDTEVEWYKKHGAW